MPPGHRSAVISVCASFQVYAHYTQRVTAEVVLPHGDALLRPRGRRLDGVRRGAREAGGAQLGRRQRPHLCHRGER